MTGDHGDLLPMDIKREYNFNMAILFTIAYFVLKLKKQTEKIKNDLIVRPERYVRIKDLYFLSLGSSCPDFCTVPVTRCRCAG
jgi:hypothetical protein